MKEPESNIRKLIDIGGLIGRKVNISCSLDEAIGELLMENALKSGKSKEREAGLRLKDRLRRFSLVPAGEQYIEKKMDQYVKYSVSESLVLPDGFVLD